MLDPSSLKLSSAHAQLLRQAMQPYFAEDGIELQGACMPGAMGQPAALSWLAQGELLRDMACASLDRVSGRKLSDSMPQGPGARVVRRLQSEMQMLLYTHPVNDERQQLGLLPINSFWVSGCGALPARGHANRPNDGAAQTSMRSNPLADDEHGNDPADLMVDRSLRKAALADDPAAFIAAWQQLDAGPVQRLQEALRQGDAVQLTLCGERSSASWTGPPQGLGAKAGQWLRGLRSPTVQQVLASL